MSDYESSDNDAPPPRAHCFNQSVASFIQKINEKSADTAYEAFAYPYNIKLLAGGDKLDIDEKYFFRILEHPSEVDASSVSNLAMASQSSLPPDSPGTPSSPMSPLNRVLTSPPSRTNNIRPFATPGSQRTRAPSSSPRRVASALGSIESDAASETSQMSISAHKTFKGFNVPFWKKKLFLDFVFLSSRPLVFDYKFIRPRTLSNPVDFTFKLMPHTRERHRQFPHFDLPSEKPFFYFHEGKTSRDENVWLIVEFESGNSPSDLQGKDKALLPATAVNAWNAAKLQCFKNLSIQDGILGHQIWSDIAHDEDDIHVRTNFFSRAEISIGYRELLLFGEQFNAIACQPEVLTVAGFQGSTKVYLALERHGQNVWLENDSLQNDCSKLARSYHWNSVSNFSVAFTWEIAPVTSTSTPEINAEAVNIGAQEVESMAVDVDYNSMASEELASNFPELMTQARDLANSPSPASLRTPNETISESDSDFLEIGAPSLFLHKKGLQDLCNAQSSKGFACVEKFLLQENTAFQDRIRMTAGKSQIYNGTRHFLRPTAKEEPFYNPFYSKTLAKPYRDLSYSDKEMLVSHSKLQEAHAEIRAQEDISKCLRIEQNIHYEFLAGQERPIDYFDSFFSDHFLRLFQVYGLNVYSWSPEGRHRLLDEISTERENNTASGKLRQTLTASKGHSVEVVELLGRPLLGLSLLCVPHYVWPGVLKAYIKMFQSLAEKCIQHCKSNPLTLLPTCSLEVIGNAERAMSYLFNGDRKKLGLSAIAKGSDDSVLNWLTHFHFPLFSNSFYDFSGLPSIRCEAWPRNEEGLLLNLKSSIKFPELAARAKCLKIELLLTGKEYVYGENNGESPIKMVAFNVVHLLNAQYAEVNPNFEEEAGICFGRQDCLDFLEGSSDYHSPQAMTEANWAQSFTRFLFENEAASSRNPVVGFLLLLIQSTGRQFLQRYPQTLQDFPGYVLNKLNEDNPVLWLPHISGNNLILNSYNIISRTLPVPQFDNRPRQIKNELVLGVNLRKEGVELLELKVSQSLRQIAEGFKKDKREKSNDKRATIMTISHHLNLSDNAFLRVFIIKSLYYWAFKVSNERSKQGSNEGRNRLYFKMGSLIGLSTLFAVLVTAKSNRDSIFIGRDEILNEFLDMPKAKFRTTKVTPFTLVQTGCFTGTRKSKGYNQQSLTPVNRDYETLWNTIRDAWSRCRTDQSGISRFLGHLGLESQKSNQMLENAVAEICTFLS